MRDILLLALIFLALMAAVRYPFVGLITWAWFSLMTPHQLAYGVYGLPLNTLIAAATIGALILHGGFSRFKIDVTSVLIALFAIWILVSQHYSLDASASAPHADRFVKVLLFAFLCAQMANTRLKIHALLWMMAIALGYFAIKGALFTLLTLGRYRVHGIDETLLSDNNHMGIALAAGLPILIYLFGEAQNKIVRLGLGATSILTVFAILGTQSRGAFISLIVFGGFYWLQSRHKIALLGVLFVIAAPAIAFMPSNWTERMGTITSANQDDSFMGRVDAWVINTELAIENPVTGAGFRNSYDPEIARRVVPKARAERARAAHSIYFEVLGGAGFVGLGLYLSLLGWGVVTARGLSRHKTLPPDHWARRYGYYAIISIAVFGVGGASTSLEMWDGYLIVIALCAATAKVVHDGLRAADTKPGVHAQPVSRVTQFRRPANH